VIHIPTDAERAEALRAAADYLVQTGVAMTPLPPVVKPAAAMVAPTIVENLALEVAKILGGGSSGSQPKKKRKASAYSKRYGKAYREVRKKNTTKRGALRKGWSHKRLVMAAHKIAKKGGKK
jgi:hypothetical protein